MSKSPEMKARQKFIRNHQLKGGSYEHAVEIWNEASEISEVFTNEGKTRADLSEGDLRDAVADWKAVRTLGF